MVRIVLLVILFIFIARTFWRIVDNVILAASGRVPGGGAPQPPLQSAKMVRDPVCGTFLLPDRAVSIASGSNRIFFCSETCRDRYRETAGRTA